MSINEQITNTINQAIGKENEQQVKSIHDCLDLCFQYIANSYNNSRECVQHVIREFNRIQSVSIPYMLATAQNSLCSLAPTFETMPSVSLKYIDKVLKCEVKIILDRISPHLSGAKRADILCPAIAEALSKEERRYMTSFIIDSISRYGLKSNWDKDTIENHIMLLMILYSICAKDGVMDLYFSSYYNILDRLATSDRKQEVRDWAENLIMIGHSQNMLAEAYYGASRAYTLCNNAVAGLFYLLFSLYTLRDSKQIKQRFAFELLWQFLKIMRISHHVNLRAIDEILGKFNNLNCSGYDRLAINYTALSARLLIDSDDFVSKTQDFLDNNREVFFSNLEHSAMPWYTLIMSFQKIHPEQSIRVLERYMLAAKSVIEKEGNEPILDMLNGENLKDRLMESLFKLQSTRDAEDYSRDNYNAMLLAKKLLTQSVANANPSDFVLAMRPKTDYTFVMKELHGEEFAQLRIEDVNGKDCLNPLDDINLFDSVVGTDENDLIFWIGKGDDSYYGMRLIRTMFDFCELPHLNKLDVWKLQSECISSQIFEKTTKQQGSSIYVKSDEELQDENNEMLAKMSDVEIEMPNIASRVLFAKDTEIASIPHQLLIDSRTGKFVGEMMPTCNIISSELLIKSNFEEQLTDEYTKSFWTPIESDEFTFQEIKGRLEDVFDRYGFAIHDKLKPEKPISANLNIVCAHGGKDIGDTHWFYANEQPIVNTRRIVGSGKILILFVCHSGSILHHYTDSAMHTIIKEYFRLGYSAVVAPMWSLSTVILPCWLSTFMESINSHDYVIDAVYKANMAVKKEYIAVSAWGCLHLFGNPYVQINDKPRLAFIEKAREE